MTAKVKCGKIKFKGARNILLSVILTTAVFMAAIYLSDDLSGYVEEALLLSARVIIPSVFPFLILTEIISPHLHFEAVKPIFTLFERVFKINGTAIPIFVCGVLCGFPIGAKMAYDAYRRGALSRDECERLMAFASNAGPSYVISAVGATARGSVIDGIILYISMIAGSVITGVVIGIGKRKSALSKLNIEQKRSFVDIVKSSATISINICAFICTFGIFIGLAKIIFPNKAFRAILISVLEVGNASVYLANEGGISPFLSLLVTSFAISFSGLSVIFQTLSIQDRDDRIDTGTYLTRKVIQGVISALVTMIIYLITVG